LSAIHPLTGTRLSRPSPASWLLAAGLGVAAIAVLAWLAHPHQLAESLDDVSPRYLLLALALNVPLVLVRALRARRCSGWCRSSCWGRRPAA